MRHLRAAARLFAIPALVVACTSTAEEEADEEPTSVSDEVRAWELRCVQMVPSVCGISC